MSYATDGYLAPRTASRPVGLLAGIAALEVLTYSLPDYTAVGSLGAEVPWMLLDAYLLRKIWRGSSGAWSVLVALNIGVIVLAAWTLFARNIHMDGGPLMVVRVVLELALLTAPRLRRWVSQG